MYPLFSAFSTLLSVPAVAVCHGALAIVAGYAASPLPITNSTLLAPVHARSYVSVHASENTCGRLE